VAGTLTTAPGATVSGTVTAGARATGPVTVSPPCPCAAGAGVDVATIIDEHRLANFDSAIGLSADALATVQTSTTLALPCGRFYLNRISVGNGGALTLRADGRVALFVGSDLTASGPLVVSLSPGAELDLFVAGALNLSGAATLGDPAAPRSLRVYLTTGGAVNLPPGSKLYGNLYAPNADFPINAALELYGAVVASHLLDNVGLAVHYDRAVAAAGGTCSP
jgi:hypothetical protein